MSAPHVPAAFINAIAEEGTKDEAIQFLQKQWNECCAMRDTIASLTEEVERLQREKHEERELAEKMFSEAGEVAFVGIRDFAAVKARAESAEATIEGLRAALEQIANHPESENKEIGSYKVGWAFWNVQQIARTALQSTEGDGR